MGTVRDLSFHLLKLHANRTHRLERSLSPATYMSHFLDYGFPILIGSLFFLAGLLVCYEHLPAYNYVALHTDFASQLESLAIPCRIMLYLAGLHSDERKRAFTVVDAFSSRRLL